LQEVERKRNFWIYQFSVVQYFTWAFR
jgi:hypothetical protein